MTVWSRSRAALSRFGGGRSGQVALTFALMTIPVLFASGAAIDYGRRNAAKTQLDSTVDAVVLSVIGKNSNVISATALANAEAQFRSEAAKLSGVAIKSFVLSPVTTTSTVSLRATYTATINTTLSSVMNITNVNFDGTSSATRNILQYINFYLLLDSSPSMGLAATDADVANMKIATRSPSLPSGCAFACHQHTYNGNGAITGDDMNDNYHIAQRYNIKLRIQVLRDAVSALVDQAKLSTTLNQQFQMEMWTFNDSTTQTRLQAMTPTLDQIKSSTPNIDIAYAYQNQADNQTDFERAIAKMNSVIPASGDGLTASTPIRFLFFVTDGVQDTGGTITDTSKGFQLNNRFMGPISPSTCNKLKNDNVRIGIIYTQYLPIYTDNWYNSYVKPYENSIGPMLQACASDNLYFPVASGGDITNAMLRLFSASLASVRITN